MIILILGVALWSATHLFKRLAPEQRASLGDRGKGLVALGVFGGLVLMVIGYRMAEGPVWWGRSSALVGINNLLMVLAFYLFAASGAKSWLTTKIRHPQLTAVKVWALAHLLVNGDLASFILFGGLLAWAVTEVILINRAEGGWQPGPVKAGGEVKAIISTVIMVVVVMGIHFWLGYQPWG